MALGLLAVLTAYLLMTTYANANALLEGNGTTTFEDPTITPEWTTGATSSSSTTTQFPTTTAVPFPTQKIMTSWEFVFLIVFAGVTYYCSLYVCARAVGESTSAMTAPARLAGSAATATGGVIGRFIRFLRQGGRVAYIPLAPSDGDLNGNPARRRARDIGHGRDVVDDFAAANDPAPSINDD